MDITSARFVTSLSDYGAFPGKGLKQVAVVGKSNVGKSSLINSLCRKKGLAKTSGTPGKTRLINVFLLNDAFHLIDLPGYGYAKVDKKGKASWGKRMGDYFQQADELCAVLQLVDIRHEPTADDLTMVGFLRTYGLPFITIATKADKLSKAARHRHILPISFKLQVQPQDIIQYSSETAEGRNAVLQAMEQALG